MTKQTTRWELKDGVVAWVRKIRAESEARVQRIQKQRDQR
jgi:hypothetical protein